MRNMHHFDFVLRQIRSFLTVIEENNLHRAGARLRLSQSALSRQMQALEHEIGGRLLDRTSTGVRPTAGGHAFAEKMKLLLADYDAAVQSVRRLVRGDSTQMKVGCVMSAAPTYLNPALKVLRARHPGIKVKLFDLSPGEQIAALRRREIDLALIDHGADLLSHDFYVRKIAVARSLVVLPADHRLASRKSVSISDLKNETFVSATEEDVPGYNNRVTQFCRKFGGFRPKFLGRPQSLAEGLSLVANDDMVAFLPDYARQRTTFYVRMVPLTDDAIWELSVARQRGPLPAPMRTLLDAISSLTAGGKKP